MASTSQTDRDKKPSPVSTVPATPAVLSVDAPSPSSEDKRAPTEPASTSASYASAKAPTVNVWSQRKEQMVSQTRSTSQTRPLNPPSVANAPAGKFSSPSSTSQPARNGVLSHDSQAGRSQNAAPRLPSSGPRQASGAPPPVQDAESWPEVGKAVAQPSPRPPQNTLSKLGEGRNEEDENGEAPQTSGPHKKSEKPKWVPLPPEEWQAPAEPRSQRSQPHSRSSSQLPHRHPRQPGSTNASQGPSKVASGRTSKASSVHSSPRRPQRGRPLPPSFDALAGRSAEASAHPSPAVIAEVQPSYPDPNGIQPQPLQQPFYAPMPPFSPAHSPHPHSYMRSPPNGFMPPPPPPFVHSNTPPPGPYPPYPYPPYGYPYQHPYVMYGYPPPPPPGPLPPEHVAGYPQYAHPQPGPPPQGVPPNTAEQEPHREATLPPLTDMTRPPPPTQVDAVTGYREVGPSNGSSTAGVVFGRFNQEKSVVRSPSPVRPALAPAQHMQAFTVGDAREDVVDRTDPEVQLSFGTLSLADAPAPHSQSAAPNGGLQVHVGGAAPPGPPTDSSTDTWEVRDYGFGFGRAGAPRLPSHSHQHQDNYGKPRRGFGNGNVGYSGRRGGRGASRGGYGGRGGGRGAPPQAQFVPGGPPPSTEGHHGLFIPPLPPPPPFFDPYAATGFAPPPMLPPPAVAGPVAATYPRPRSVFPTPLDPLRHQLLGQLEYYLSSENFAGDLFLRRNMDARGWIPISLLASFKRVRALTPSERIVVDTLALSRIVEVRNIVQGAYVRAARGEWEPFVLPSAAQSIVEPPAAPSPEGVPASTQSPLSPAKEEDEEVEFVLDNATAITS